MADQSLDDLSKPYFGNPNIQAQGALARANAAQRSADTVADPKTLGAVQAALGAASGMVTPLIGGAVGLAKSIPEAIRTGQAPAPLASQYAEQYLKEHPSYQPDSTYGQEYLGKLGDYMEAAHLPPVVGDLTFANNVGEVMAPFKQMPKDYLEANPPSVGLSIKPEDNIENFLKPEEVAMGFNPAGLETGMMGMTKAVKPSLLSNEMKVLPNDVSTRVPTAVKATEDPLKSTLLSDYPTMKKDPEALEHNLGLIKTYPNFVSKSRSVNGQMEDFINNTKDNLLFLHDMVPADTRERSKLWYDGAHNIVDRFGNQYGTPEHASAGVLAVLSPQKDWFMNVSLGDRVHDIWKNQGDYKWDKDMTGTANEIFNKPQYAPMLKAIKGKAFNELTDPTEKAMWLRTFDQTYNPREHQIVTPEGDFSGTRLTDKGQPYKTGWGSLNEIGKAIDILDNPSKENISANLGGQHKVRNFYNNIYFPNNPDPHVTIDTHAVAAGLLRPLSGNSREVSHNFGSNALGEVGPKNSAFTGLQGTYPAYAEAYKRAAEERGLLPRQMQSITWEAVRGLFPDTFKNATNNAEINNIWDLYKRKKITIDDARQKILEKAGGINEPEWKQ